MHAHPQIDRYTVATHKRKMHTHQLMKRAHTGDTQLHPYPKRAHSAQTWNALTNTEHNTKDQHTPCAKTYPQLRCKMHKNHTDMMGMDVKYTKDTLCCLCPQNAHKLGLYPQCSYSHEAQKIQHTHPSTSTHDSQGACTYTQIHFSAPRATN